MLVYRFLVQFYPLQSLTFAHFIFLNDLPPPTKLSVCSPFGGLTLFSNPSEEDLWSFSTLWVETFKIHHTGIPQNIPALPIKVGVHQFNAFPFPGLQSCFAGEHPHFHLK